MLICAFLMFSRYIREANKALQDQMKEGLPYEITLSGRMTSLDRYSDYFRNEQNIEEEYKNLKNYLDEHDADYHPVTIVYTTEYTISEDPDAYIRNYAGNAILDVRVVLFGAEPAYFEEHDIEIAEGRPMREGNFSEIVVNENMLILENGTVRQIEVGDVLSFPIGIVIDRKNGGTIIPDAKEYLEYEVVGTYKSRAVDVFAGGTAEYKLNQRYYVSKEDCIYHLERFFNQYHLRRLIPGLHAGTNFISYYMPSSMLSDVRLTYDDEALMKKGIEDLEKLFKTLNQDEENASRPLSIDPAEKTEKKIRYEYSTSLDAVEKIMSALESLEENIKLFTIIDFFVSIVIVFLILNIELKRRSREFSVKQVTGMSPENVFYEAVLEYGAISLLASLSGVVLSMIISPVLVKNAFSRSVQLQNELIRISSGRIDALNDYSSIDLDRLSIHIGFPYVLMSLIVPIVAVSLFTILIVRHILKDSIRKSLNSI